MKGMLHELEINLRATEQKIARAKTEKTAHQKNA